jgi:S-DNA-T family DNA segregation ATPase FtsK/SpoIIIE
MDMINRPDAAMIKNPGRLYLQVGYNEIYECMQSGYSGAEYIPTDTYVSDDSLPVLNLN